MTVVHALKQLPDGVRLTVIGYETIGHIGYIQSFLTTAEEGGVGDRVAYAGTFPLRQQALEALRRADVGLALMSKTDDFNEATMAGASNKAFDYLACGVAVLVADVDDWRRLYVDPGYGLASDTEDPNSIALTLRWFLEHPSATQAMGEAGRQRIASEWNYEQQFAPVLRNMMQPSNCAPDRS
jgi:glycosyltransferase involved in cell wall biosynthesis